MEKQCRTCKYYHGRDNVICGPHLYGPESTQDNCSDFSSDFELEPGFSQPSILDWNWQKISLIISRAVTLAEVGVCFYTGVKAYPRYQSYVETAQPFLEKASVAVSTGVAGEELGLAWKWVEKNYPPESFVYRDLKGNLNYLKQQQLALPVPTSIQSSIKNIAGHIDEAEVQFSPQTEVFKIFSIVLCAFVLDYVLLGMIYAKSAQSK